MANSEKGVFNRLLFVQGDTLLSNWSVLVVVLGRLLYYAACFWGAKTSDTIAYGYFSWRNFLTGDFSMGIAEMAPVYGMFLSVRRYLPAAMGYSLVLILQIICSFLAFLLFRRILRLLNVPNTIAAIVSVLYGLNPAVHGWDTVLLTESFSLSATILCIYHLVLWVKEEKLWDLLWLCGITLFLIFLRPQFLIYYMLMVGYVLVRYFFHLKERLLWLAVLAAEGAVILLYCAVFYRSAGIFTLSAAKVRQDCIVCVQQRYYENIEDSPMRNDIAEWTEAAPEDVWAVWTNIVEKYNYPQMKEFAAQCYRENRTQRLSNMVQTALNDLSTPFYAYDKSAERGELPERYRNLFREVFGIFTIGGALLITLLQGGKVVVRLVRREPPWIDLGLFLFPLTTYLMPYWGTCDEYMRTMISILPYCYLIVACFFCMRRCAGQPEG